MRWPQCLTSVGREIRTPFLDAYSVCRLFAFDVNRSIRGEQMAVGPHGEGGCACAQAALPSTVPTLLRTALKLQAFPFNALPAGGAAADARGAPPAAGADPDRGGPPAGPDGPAPAERLCVVCAAPLAEREALGAHEASLAARGLGAGLGSEAGSDAPCAASAGVGPAAPSGGGAGAASGGADPVPRPDAAARSLADACCYACRQSVVLPPGAGPGARRGAGQGVGPGPGTGLSGAGRAAGLRPELLPPLLRGDAAAAACLRLTAAGVEGRRQALRAQIADYVLEDA